MLPTGAGRRGQRLAISLTFLLLATLAATACSGDAATPTPIPNTLNLTLRAANGATIQVTAEIADNPAARATGLMNRDSLPDDHGMLFVFSADTRAGFWMKDTQIPLSIAFISNDGAIIDIQDMQPLSTDLLHAPQPYRFALEVNQDWFASHSITIGDTVGGLPNRPR